LAPENETSSPSQSSFWPLALLGILVSWLASSAMRRSSTEYQISATQPQGTTRKEGDGSPEQSAMIAKVVPSPPSKNKSDYCRYPKTAWWKTLAEMIGIGAVVWYAFLTQSMWKEMRTQTRIQRQAGINTERAWVGLDGPITIDVLEISPRLKVESHYSVKNFGHGPALKVIPSGWFETNRKLLDGSARSACDLAQAFTTGTVPKSQEMRTPGPMGYILFPGQTHQETIGSPIDPWQGAGEPDIKHFWFIGCIAYLDQFKMPHWTRFCMDSSNFLQPINKNTPIDFCSLYNDTDQPRD